jgi:hypothetical protein
MPKKDAQANAEENLEVQLHVKRLRRPAMRRGRDDHFASPPEIDFIFRVGIGLTLH